jgi:2-amino-4-hydroxy-6-hydroxymethyldihydropteridine diphosphokinase
LSSTGTLVAIALGSNLGDREAHLDFAAARLASVLEHPRFSPRYNTEPVGTPEPQPRFLNAAAVGTTRLDPFELLKALQAIEAARGRERPYRNAPRTLDLDLILFGDLVHHAPDLTVPHPRFRDRSFVLQPLVDIAPEMVDPVSGMTVAALLDAITRAR